MFNFSIYFSELHMSISLDKEDAILESFLTDNDPHIRIVAKMMLDDPNLTVRKAFQLYKEQQDTNNDE